MSVRASNDSKAGIVIAIVGPDGSGKTTLAREIVGALGGSPRAFTSHLGGPAGGTWLTRPLRVVIAGVRKGLWMTRRAKHSKEAKQRYPAFQAMLDVCKALDRMLLAYRCHAGRRAGCLVVTDRYPGKTPGSASGPRRYPRGTRTAARQLHRIEIRIYESIPPPDLVLRLSAPVELTVHRNAIRPQPKSEQKVRASHEAAELLRFPGVKEIVVDTALPLEKTVPLIVFAITDYLATSANDVS